MTDLQDTIDIVAPRLAAALLDQQGLRVEKVEVDRVVRRPYSSVVFLRAATPLGTRRLVLKKTEHHEENLSLTASENQALVEYGALCALYPRFQAVPRCGVPKPVLVLPDHEAYVMEYVPGRLLGECFGGAKLYGSRRAFEELREWYFLAGVWLRELQGFTGIRAAGRDACGYTMMRCEERLRMIEERRHPSCPAELPGRVRGFIEGQLRLVQDGELLVTGRHGDFGSWNMMAGCDGITVFDFLGYRDDLLPVDFLKMLLNFEVERSYLVFSTRRIDQLEDSFRAGYGPLPKVAAPVLALCEALHRICSLSACLTTPPGNLLRRIEREKIMRAHISWFMKDEKPSLWWGRADHRGRLRCSVHPKLDGTLDHRIGHLNDF